MTGKGERKVREWAQRRNGDPLTPHDVVELVFALDDDNAERHQESMDTFRLHFAEAEVRDNRIAVLEEWRRDSALTCEKRVCELIEREHAQRHDAYVLTLDARRANDSPTADYTKKRAIVAKPDESEEDEFHNRLVWFFASNLGKFVIFIFGGVVLALFNLLIYGRP